MYETSAGRRIQIGVTITMSFSRRSYACFLLAILPVFVGCADTQPSTTSIVVQTANGAIAGTSAASPSTSMGTTGTTPSVEKYLGTPYAAPPVGDLRWRPPQTVTSWTDVRDAGHFAPHCPQAPSAFGEITGASEDCLYLNVYTPSHKATGLPVMVWIHGGAFNFGESDDYDGTSLATTGNVIVITINYRLGALGFLAHPALAAEPGNTTGNYGLLDQQAALLWVRTNAAAFGGDPSNVTIFGESAGGSSVSAQLASPSADGLFEKAIIESGFYDPSMLDATEAQATGTAFAASIGCTLQTTQCLRAASTAAILKASAPFPAAGANQFYGAGLFSPTRGTAVLPLAPIAAFASGAFNKVPVLNGTNHDELGGLAAIGLDTHADPLDPTGYTTEGTITLAQTISLYGSLMGNNVTLATQLAATLNPGALVAPEIVASGTDAIFSCTARLADRELDKYVPVYAYEFNVEDAKTLLVPPTPLFAYGATHSDELGYLFPAFLSQFPSVGHESYTPAQATLAQTMQQAWTNFAKTGTPNGPGVPRWAPYSSATDVFESLLAPEPTTIGTFTADHSCRVYATFDLTLVGLPVSFIGDL